MKRSTAILLVLLLCFFGAKGNAYCFEYRNVEVHGFLSQGYLKSTVHDFLGFPSENGSFAFSEAGVNFSGRLSDKLHLGLQLFAIDFGSYGNHDVVLDWAVGDYRWRDWLGLRFGKVKLPAGLYGQSLDADMLRTFIFLSQATYDYRLRTMWNAYLGGELYGIVGGPWKSSFEYELFGGTLDLDNAPFARNMARKSFATKIPDGMQVSLGEMTTEYRYLVGGALRWNTPLENLRLGVSCYSGRGDTETAMIVSMSIFDQVPVLQVTSQILSVGKAENKYNYVLSAEYGARNLTISVEYLRQRMEYASSFSVEMPGMPSTMSYAVVGEGMYGQACYRLSDLLELGVYYSLYYSNMDDRNGDSYTARGEPSFFAWQRDLCMALRIDITPHWLVKLEAHLMDGIALAETNANPAEAKRYWGLFGVKTTLSF